MTLEEERNRREAALVEFESLVGLLKLFIHGTAEDTVPTQNGPIKTLAAVTKYADEHDTEVTEFLTELSNTMDGLAPTLNT